MISSRRVPASSSHASLRSFSLVEFRVLAVCHAPGFTCSIYRPRSLSHVCRRSLNYTAVTSQFQYLDGIDELEA
jgi:hypothetical protein